MRVLVIGGTGFIGKYVVRELAELLHEVVVFHRGQTTSLLPDGVKEIIGDRRRLTDSTLELREFAPEVVLDMILSSGAQAEELMSVFEGVAQGVVAVSSMDVYRAAGILHGREEGEPDNSPLTENSPLRKNLHPYGPETIETVKKMYGWVDDDYDKIPVERTIMSDSGLPGTVVRLPMVYGPGDPGHRFFPILKRVDDGRPAILLEERMAAWRGCRGYVENVAHAIALAVHLNRSAGRIYNVADADNFSELEWTQRVAERAGFEGSTIVLPESGTPAHLKPPYRMEQHWEADSTRIREELGYREPIPLDEAIDRTIAWERANPPDEIDPARFDYNSEDRALASRL